jgi:hypothetical protein
VSVIPAVWEAEIGRIAVVQVLEHLPSKLEVEFKPQYQQQQQQQQQKNPKKTKARKGWECHGSDDRVLV